MKTKIAGNPILTLRSDRLHIDGVLAEDLIQNHSAPLQIFSARRIQQNCHQFLETMERIFQDVEVYYSYKTNFQPELCKIIHSHGIHAEVVSSQELELAFKLLNDGSRIQLGTPNLTKGLLRKALKHQVACIDILSLNQLRHVAEASQDLENIQTISLRLRPNIFGKTLGLSLDENQLSEIFEILGKSPWLSLSMLHGHRGTQLMDAKPYIENVSQVLSVAEKIEQAHGLRVKRFNLGGGFPEATTLILEQLEQIGIIMQDSLHERGWDSNQIIFEPGRYLVADAGFIVSTIIDYDFSSPQPWLRLDVGNHNCPTASKAHFRFFSVEHVKDGHHNQVSLFGCLPSETDLLALRSPFLPKKQVQVGDHVLIVNTGAYTQSWGLKFPYSPIPQILIDENEIKRI